MPALVRGIISKHIGDFYCLNSFHSYGIEKKLKKHYNVCKNHDCSYAEILQEDNKILKYNHKEYSMKVPFVIYADLESLLVIIYPGKSSTTKINKNTPSDYSLFANFSFDLTKSKLDCYRGKDCMESFCINLKEYATKIINYEKKEMIALTDEENKSYKKQKVCDICKKEFTADDNDKNAFKLYHKVRDHCHYTGKYRGAFS